MGFAQAVDWFQHGAKAGVIVTSETFSRFTDLKGPVAGTYRVDVVTASGQLIGRLRFTITP